MQLLNSILTQAVQMGASDVHIKVGNHPVARISGKLIKLKEFPVVTSETARAMATIIPEKIRAEFLKLGEADFAYSVPKLGRFRANAYMQRSSLTFAFRAIPGLNFDIASLGLPNIIKSISNQNRGLVLVTGITGSGKSTTLAAMIDYINKTMQKNVITLEDPIEFLHSDHQSIISQREIGSDTMSFSQGLRRAMRQDPDIILVGEMRDLETVETALHAAETGHLVFSTLHTTDASETINRIIALFDPHEQQQIRLQLAGVLHAIISQRLVPRRDGKGRAAAVEVLINTSTIKECIMDSEKTELIYDYIRQGSVVYGMQTFDQSLYNHVISGLVSEEEALNWVKRKEDFVLMLKGISSNADSWATE